MGGGVGEKGTPADMNKSDSRVLRLGDGGGGRGGSIVS